MFDRLIVFETKYEELSVRLCDPSVAADPEKYTAALKELKEIEPVAAAYKEYKPSCRRHGKCSRQKRILPCWK